MPEKGSSEADLEAKTTPHPKSQHPTTLSVLGLSHPLGILDTAINRDRGCLAHRPLGQFPDSVISNAS